MEGKALRALHFSANPCGCLLTVTGLLTAVAPPVSAADTVELVLQLETSLTSDSNPFRFYSQPVNTDPANTPDTPVTPLGLATPERDTVKGSDIRAGAIIPLLSDRTRLTLTGSLGNRYYKNYKELDHHVVAGDATLDWAAGQVFNGHVSAGKEDRLFQYINGTFTDKDISHQKRASADLNLKLTDEWSLNVKVDKSGLNYDLPVNQLYNFDERGRQFSGRYYSPTGSSVEVGTRLSDSNFPDRNAQEIADLDQSYKESEVFLDAEWRYSSKSVTSTHLGIIRRRYDNLTDRDTNLFNALWRGTYHYSPKLRLDLQLWDRPFTIVDRSVLYVITKALRFDAQWKYSDKSQMNFSTLLQNSDNVLVPRLASLSDGSSRKEQLLRIGFGGAYEFERGFRVVLDSFYEKVRRESDGINLKQAVIKLGLEYTYENLPGSTSRMGLKRYQHSLSASDSLR
ncbi:hypothetical protein H8L32_00325 [Undibacterium sp. CY18W]|uniref:Beta-barrel porin 2 n=1 Tax=Undibacterium hunanense TaxID=2762292 RepID=A0ABR6ZKE4_9BURK|nr:hypothetical protein [Undibacterium hunanense]MBC3915915.1 hypothetical protein [Undibacterium hunanense]